MFSVLLSVAIIILLFSLQLFKNKGGGLGMPSPFSGVSHDATSLDFKDLFARADLSVYSHSNEELCTTRAYIVTYNKDLEEGMWDVDINGTNYAITKCSSPQEVDSDVAADYSSGDLLYLELQSCSKKDSQSFIQNYCDVLIKGTITVNEGGVVGILHEQDAEFFYKNMRNVPVVTVGANGESEVGVGLDLYNLPVGSNIWIVLSHTADLGYENLGFSSDARYVNQAPLYSGPQDVVAFVLLKGAK